MNQTTINKELIAPCGVYCAACSAFMRGTCLGCRSNSHKQKRISKWACSVRNCVLDQKQIDHCGTCDELICKTYHQKLLKGHQTDQRYNYRFEAVTILSLLHDKKEAALANMLTANYRCRECGGSITFYEYSCFNCGFKQFPESR